MRQNPAKGFPTSTKATLTRHLAFAGDQEQPLGSSFTYFSVIEDFDSTISVGAPHPSGRILITKVVVTGKW